MASNYNRKSGSSGSRNSARGRSASGSSAASRPSSPSPRKASRTVRMPQSSTRSKKASYSSVVQPSARPARTSPSAVRKKQPGPSAQPTRGNRRSSATARQVKVARSAQTPIVRRYEGGGARQSSRTADSRVSAVRIGDMNRTVRSQSRGVGSWAARAIMAVVLLAILGIAVFALYSSNMFPIEQVRVSGVEHLTESEMADLAAVPAGTTLLRVDTGAIDARLMSNPWVQSASVDREFPNTLSIKITERAIAAIVVVSTDKQQTENWAIASDGMWLMRVPDQSSDEAKSISPQVYQDVANVLRITDVPYGVKPDVGSRCTDSSVLNALAIVSGLTTSLADEVTAVSAADTVNTVLTLNNGIQIAFGTADDIRDKERVCLQLMQQYPGQIAYINVRVVDKPTWRAVSS